MASPVDLLRHLMRAALTDDWARLSLALEQYRTGCESTWEECERLLRQHRLTAPVGAVLAQAPSDQDACAAERLIPSAVYARLSEAYATAVAANRARLDRYGELLAVLRTRGIEPLLLKSGALVALDVMHLGSGMGDVDVLIRPDEAAAVEETLTAHGYSVLEHPAGDWLDPTGALRLDLHKRFLLFAHLDLDALVVEREARYPGLGRVRVFEPNACMVYLTVHLNQHRRELGYQLYWLLDVGRALRAWESELSWERMAALVRWPYQRLWMLRTLKFFATELGIELPPTLAVPAAAVSPVTLAETLRARRMQPWAFDRWRTWPDFARCLAGRGELGKRILPHVSDPLLRVVDIYRERRDLRRLRAGSSAGSSGVVLKG